LLKLLVATRPKRRRTLGVIDALTGDYFATVYLKILFKRKTYSHCATYVDSFSLIV